MAADYVDPTEGGTAPFTPQDLEAFRRALGEQVTADLEKDPGPLPFAPSGDEAPFHQYLIAIGAVGMAQREMLGEVFHDLGMTFAQTMGLDPLLCVGYVSPSQHRPDYLSAANIWHSQMTRAEHEQLRKQNPRFYMSLELLFGRPNSIGGEATESLITVLEREIMNRWIDAIGGMDWYNAGITEGSQTAQMHGRALAAVLDAVFRDR
jgi:hypothetical protein